VLGFNYVFYNHCVLRTDCVKDLGALLYLWTVLVSACYLYYHAIPLLGLKRTITFFFPSTVSWRFNQPMLPLYGILLQTLTPANWNVSSERSFSLCYKRYFINCNSCLLASCFHASFLRYLFFDPEDGGDMFLRNVGWHSTDYTALYPRR
jgi:hypothetical protein